MSLTMEQEQLVLENSGLSHYFANKYFHENLTHDDLASVGFIGLIKASKNFDKSLGYKFATLAAKCIQGEIIKSFRKKQIPTISLNLQVYDDDDFTERIDLLASDVSVENEVQLKIDLPIALAKLDKRERDVITYRFGLDNDGMSLSQTETGEKLGIHQVQVGRIEKVALAKLRYYLESDSTLNKK